MPYTRASERLHDVAEAASGARARKIEAGALVLRVLETPPGPGGDFLRRRAAGLVAALGRSPERALLRRLLLTSAGPNPCDSRPGHLGELLVTYAGTLASGGRLTEADAVLRLARKAYPSHAETALHAGRVARQLGQRARARLLYQLAARLSPADEHLGRLAALGLALISRRSEEALGDVIRDCRSAGDMEAACIGWEERAAIRFTRGNRRGAAMDLYRAARRFADRADRGRVLLRLAECAAGAGETARARIALLKVLDEGVNEQVELARDRLHWLSRAAGDQLGVRRWRASRPQPLVAISGRISL